MPQLPQLLGSLRETQVFPQRMNGFWHWQVLFVHVPVPQLFGHEPQCAGSLVVLVHCPLQLTKPGGQPSWQTLLTQAWPVPHATPQPPQFAGSVVVVTHAPLQLVWPAAH